LAECPFCGSSVDEDLVVYGGPCPKCFAEIPGEEAPTDPGAEARAAQEKRDRRGATLKAAIGMGAMMALVGCAGVAALAVVLWPEPEVAVLDFDSAEFDYPAMELVGNVEEVEEEGEPVDVEVAKVSPKPRPSASPKPRKEFDPSAYGKVEVPGSDGVDAGAALGKEDGIAQVDGTRGTRGVDGPAGGPAGIDAVGGDDRAQQGGIGLDIDLNVQRRTGVVLSDPDQIRQMIGKLMGQQVRKLSYCYERRLKQKPDLGGRWLIKYTVSKDGTAIDASATGRDVSDAELESCLVQNIESKWRFDPIVRAQPVQKTLTFRPG
jgi:hypothetical protein